MYEKYAHKTEEHTMISPTTGRITDDDDVTGILKHRMLKA